MLDVLLTVPARAVPDCALTHGSCARRHWAAGRPDQGRFDFR
jgi:hypothetical protein